MKTKKILLVSSKYMPEYSGSGYRAHNLYKRLVEACDTFSVDVLCGSTTENEYVVYDYEGFNVTRVACKPFPTLSGSRLIRTGQIAANFHSEYRKTTIFLRNMPEKPDLIHIFGECYASATVIDYASKNSIPLLIEICNEVASPHQYVPFPHKFWVSGIAPKHSRFVCISENLRKICIKRGIRDEMIWCRPNPVDERRFFPVENAEKIELRRKLTKFDERDVVISYIAKFRPSKNHGFLLDVIKHLPENFKLFMKGPLVESGPLAERDGNLFEALRKRVVEEGLSERVELESGFCDPVDGYYKMADVYAFPSITEGLGTPLLESLACGVPVVSNLIPDTTDVWIKNGENGYLSSLDPREFASKLRTSAEMGGAARSKAAAEIKKMAGTSVIDAGYVSMIKELTDDNE